MSHDLRKYAKQTNFRLILGGLLLLFVVGLGSIYILYGPRAALTGMICLVVGLSPLLLIWIMFLLIEFVTRKAGDR